MCGIPATWKIDFRARLSKVLVVFALSCLARRLGFNFGMRKWRLPRLGGCRLHPFDACPPSGIRPKRKGRGRTQIPHPVPQCGISVRSGLRDRGPGVAQDHATLTD